MVVTGLSQPWLEDAVKRVQSTVESFGYPLDNVKCAAVKVLGYWTVRVSGGSLSLDIDPPLSYGKNKESTQAYAQWLSEGLTRPPVVSYRLVDTGPFDFYQRVVVPAGTEGRMSCFFSGSTTSPPDFYYTLGQPVTNRKQHVATLADTNLSPHGILDESLLLREVSWQHQFKTENVVLVQRFLDQTVFEFYVGGEKPYYQCNMALMAHWDPFAVSGSINVTEHNLKLHKIEKRWFQLNLLSPAIVEFDLFLRMGCRRERGVC